MSKRTLLGLVCVLAASAMVPSNPAVADKFDKDPKHQLPRPDTKAADLKKPVKVFILMGQSNMVGMGEVGPESTKGTLQYLTKVDKRYPHLLDDAGKWTARSDVRHVFVMQNKGQMQTVQNDWLSVKGKTIGPEPQARHLWRTLRLRVSTATAHVAQSYYCRQESPNGQQRLDFVPEYRELQGTGGVLHPLLLVACLRRRPKPEWVVLGQQAF